MQDEPHGLFVEIPLAPGEAKQFIGQDMLCMPLSMMDVAKWLVMLGDAEGTLTDLLILMQDWLPQDTTEGEASDPETEGQSIALADISDALDAIRFTRILLARAKLIPHQPEGKVQ